MSAPQAGYQDYRGIRSRWGDLVMKLKNMIITGSLAAFALVFNMFEGSLPMPLPGIKLGAANVFSLLALVLLGVKEAFAVTLIRVFLAWVMTGNFLLSFAAWPEA